jgi:hypothetical protein
MFIQLTVNNEPVERAEMPRYAVRWSGTSDKLETSLYRDGKRLTEPWFINMVAASEGGGDCSA